MEKKNCITEEKNKKKTQYVLRDHMFKFWYQFIPMAVSVIEMGQGKTYYEKVVKPQIHSFMGGVFEESSIDKTAVIGECKFKSEKIDKEVYETLVRRSKLLPGNYHVIRFLLFSLSGFTKWFDHEDIHDVIKITIEELYL